MDRKIYHGSSKIVRTPAFGSGRAFNDFGLGFYCSEYPQYAAEWAVGRDRGGFVSAYTLDAAGLRVINLCGPQYGPLHWLALLFNYREFDLSSETAYRAKEYISKYFAVDHQGCDCIIGYRADNSCFMFAQEFLDGRLSYQALRKALSEDDSNRQIALKSNRAFDRVTYTGYETAASGDHFPAAAARELRALRRAGKSDGGLLITRIIEEEIKPYDARLR